MPGGVSASTSRTICALRSTDQVGCPRWSSTTSRVSLVVSRSIMVLTKFGPPTPYNHAVRTIQESAGRIAHTAHSPAALLRPYAERGASAESSRYGLLSSPLTRSLSRGEQGARRTFRTRAPGSRRRPR
jgi:hypothetical protein